MLQWKIKKHYVFWECDWSLRYLECKAHAPFRHLWPVWIYHIFKCIRKIAKSDYSALTCPSFRLSTRLEQLGSHWAVFHEICYSSTFLKPVDIFRVLLKVTRITGNLHKDQCVQGEYKLSEDFANTWCYYHLKVECLQFHSDLKCIRCNRERHTRHAWEGLAGMGVSPEYLPCHTWGAHRMHLRSLWNCRHSSFKWS
jgi:hypothetical protein